MPADYECWHHWLCAADYAAWHADPALAPKHMGFPTAPLDEYCRNYSAATKRWIQRRKESAA